MTDKPGGFCIDCGHQVDSFDGLKACPACNSQGIPAAHRDQVALNVNWQELRILVIWAENYGRQHNLQKSVYSIARRLEDQHPDRALSCPLTLAGELRQLKDTFPGMQILNDEQLKRDTDEFKRINDPPDQAAP